MIIAIFLSFHNGMVGEEYAKGWPLLKSFVDGHKKYVKFK